MYSLVYVRVHVCTPSYTSGYMYVPTRIRQGTQIYSVICSWVLNLLYYWAIVLVLCFECFRSSAIFSVVVSVLRRCTITVLLYDKEATHCPYHGNYPCTVHVIVHDHCLYVQERKLFTGMALVTYMVHSRTIPRLPLYMEGTNGQISPPEGCRTNSQYDINYYYTSECLE